MRHSGRLALATARERLRQVWSRHEADLDHWRQALRPQFLRLLAERSATLAWSQALLIVLLDELDVDDSLAEFVGDLRHVSVRQFPQVIAVAIALRHSWRPDTLTHLARRLGISLTAAELADPSTLPQASAAATPRGPRTGHHTVHRRARRRAVKALRSAPTPFGAGGLDRAAGRARQRRLRDDPADHPRGSRRSRS